MTPVSLTDTDWNAEWMRLQAARESAHDSSYWDRRADDFSPSADTTYATTFIAYVGLLPGESVLDVGCGAGTLALPLARDGHAVRALDFSERMLAILEARAAAEGLQNVTTVRASWEDDWRAAGVGAVDVAIASRSIAVKDLRAALRKLDEAARRRVCLTVPTDALLPSLIAQAAVGRARRRRTDYIYTVTVLFQMGITPEVRLLRHVWDQPFASLERARDSLRHLVAPVDGHEEELLDRYLTEHLHETGDGEAWKLDQTIAMSWAFIAWDKA